jgi:hypothetical protein
MGSPRRAGERGTGAVVPMKRGSAVLVAQSSPSFHPSMCIQATPSRSANYRAAGEGAIVLLKVGRTTLLGMASARAFLASLPRAEIHRRPQA